MTRKSDMPEKHRQEAVAVIQDQHREQNLHPREGEWYTFVTAAPIYHGRLVALTPCHYILEKASWIPETGRLSEYVKNPAKVAVESEYIGEMGIERTSVMSFFPVPPGEIPTK